MRFRALALALGAAAAAAPWRRAPRHLLVWTVDEGAALRALLSRGADEVSVVSNAPFALRVELEALRAAAGCTPSPRIVYD